MNVNRFRSFAVPDARMPRSTIQAPAESSAHNNFQQSLFHPFFVLAAAMWRIAAAPPLFARSALHESRAVRFVVRMPPPAEKGRKRQKTGASFPKRRFPCLSAEQVRIAVERGRPRRNGAGRFPDPARFRRSRDMSRGKYP